MPGDLLIDVARFHGVPLHWRCGQGTCGTCAVRIVHAAQPGLSQPGSKERNVLRRAGLCSKEQAARAQWPDRADIVRLACHLVVGELPWRVQLPEDS